MSDPTPPLDLTALRNDAEGWMLVSNIVDMEIPAPTVLALLDRLEASEAKLAAVRELHTKTPIYDDQCDDADCGQEHFEAMDSELYHCATAAYYACEECHKMTDGELDEYPCPTIRALDGAE